LHDSSALQNRINIPVLAKARVRQAEKKWWSYGIQIRLGQGDPPVFRLTLIVSNGAALPPHRALDQACIKTMERVIPISENLHHS
jgi:hypothetical protein